MSNETRNMKSERPTDIDFCLQQFHATKLKAHSIRREAESDLLEAMVKKLKALENMMVTRSEGVNLDRMKEEIDRRIAEISPNTDGYHDLNTGQVNPPKKRGRPAKTTAAQTTTTPAENTAEVANG